MQRAERTKPHATPGACDDPMDGAAPLMTPWMGARDRAEW